MAKTNAADRELEAMGAILKALDQLDGESIQRVLDYVFNRLSIATPGYVKPQTTIAPVQTTHSIDSVARAIRPSIRDLKDEKQPESSNQMAALVGYYLSDVVDAPENKDTITTADLEKYFKQAGFRLPRSLDKTLSNAAAAGYFDAEGSGRYRLNPVGYNLVVHGLPRSHKTDKPRRKTSKKVQARKSKA